jgi:hypothetical protein
MDEEIETFRRVKFLQATEPIQDAKEAYCRLSEDPNHAMANAFIGLEMLLALEEIFSEDKVQHATRHLEIAVKSGNDTRVICNNTN